MDVQLVMFKSDGSRRAFPVTKSRMLVGRHAKCDLRIPLPCVSRYHCEMRRDPQKERLKLRDLGSSNGTWHNHDRVQQETELAAGDSVRIGPVVFTVVLDSQGDPVEPPSTTVDAGELAEHQS